MNKSSLSPVKRTVQKELEQNFSGISSLRFIVAVSGGIDSMALLHICCELDITVIVAHVNYNKRGEASDKDAALVEQKCKEWGFEVRILEVDPNQSEGQNFQQWAREKRYQFFRELKGEFSADGIVLAHHEDDQIETILQKIFRGAGLASWSGMQVWDGELFRPFLGVSRQKIEQYAEQNEIPYRTDESNLQSNFARNLLRNEWLKKLSDFFPGWKKNVLRIEQQAENYEQSLEWISQRITDEYGIKRSDFDLLNRGLQQAVVLFLVKNEFPSVDVSHDSLDRVEQLNKLQPGKEIALTDHISLVVDREHYTIQLGREKVEPVKLERTQVDNKVFEIDQLQLEISTFQNPDFERALYIALESISWPVIIRQWQSGDTFQPLGMEGHQKVADHLTNRKVSAAYKDRALVVESFEETICAIIFPPIKKQMPPGTISEQVKCTAETKKCLVVKYRNQ